MSERRIALVLPGGGARGAYEAGALSVLLPALERRGERPTVVCGTSVGAINAAVVASTAHRPAAEQAAVLVETWRDIRRGEVMAPFLGPGLALLVARFAAEALGLPGRRVAGFMDPSPLRASLNRWIDWPQLRRNMDDGVLDAVCAVATSLHDGAPVAFVDGRGAGPATPPGTGLRFVPTRLLPEHVRASAAIPMLFPPVRVRRPRSAAGDYVDGATRLNTPLKPALALGATHVAVVAFEPLRPARVPRSVSRPGLADVAANVVDGLLVDQVVDDIRRLAALNSFFAEAPDAAVSPATRAYRAGRSPFGYRRIPYAIVAPARAGQLGSHAAGILRRYRGWRGVTAPDYALLARVLGDRKGTAELLSFLLFDPDFLEQLIHAGRRDAGRWLRRHPQLWCADAAHDLGLDDAAAPARREEVALEEFRARRR